MSELRHLDADLNAEDDDGSNWTIVDLDQFDPAVIYPGAFVTVGRPGPQARAQVIRTELRIGHGSGDVFVLVTFYQTALKTLEEALQG